VSDELRNVTVVVVGFRVDIENSIGYEKLRTPDDAELGAAINRLIHDHKADFLSVRAVEVPS